MAENKEEASDDLDEDGLVIQKYLSMVLVVVPSKGYDETCLRYARSALFNVHVGTFSVSTQAEGSIEGRLQDEFWADGPLEGQTMDDYAGVLFVDGEGVEEMIENETVLGLARDAMRDGKLVGAWGRSVGVLAKAGVLKGRKVAGAPELAADVKRAGGKFKPVETLVDGELVTARDEAAGMRFGKALVQVVAVL